MSGHSKWNNNKRKKQKTDSQRAKIFTKIGREIAVAVKEGGSGDPNVNSRLKDVIAKAKQNNVPNDNIERIIKKASGEGNSDNFESIQYEGYGPCGVAVIVETLTDNRNRTAGDLRHYFDKFGGNLGTPGCVSFMFQKKGVLVIEKEGREEDQVMEDALEAGASDFQADEDVFEIQTEPEDFPACGTTWPLRDMDSYRLKWSRCRTPIPASRMPIWRSRWASCLKCWRITTTSKPYGTTGRIPTRTRRNHPSVL